MPGYWRSIQGLNLRSRRNNAEQLCTPPKTTRGFMGVCPTNINVFCGLGKCIQPCSSGGPVGGAGPRLRTIKFLYNWSECLVRIASNKSDLFLMDAGLHQGCPFSPILCITFMDRMFSFSQEVEGVQFSDLRITSLLLTDDAVLLLSSSRSLHHALGLFAAECEGPRLKISTF